MGHQPPMQILFDGNIFEKKRIGCVGHGDLEKVNKYDTCNMRHPLVYKTFS